MASNEGGENIDALTKPEKEFLEKLLSQHENHKDEIQNLLTKILDLSDKFLKARSLYNEGLMRNNEMQTTIGDQSQSIAALKVEKENFSNENKDLQKKKKDLKAGKEAAEEKVKKLNEKIKTLKDDMAPKQSGVQQPTTLITTAQNVHINQNNPNDENKTKYDETLKDLKAAKKTIIDRDKSIAGLKDEKVKLENEITGLKDANIELRLKITNLENVTMSLESLPEQESSLP